MALVPILVSIPPNFRRDRCATSEVVAALGTAPPQRMDGDACYLSMGKIRSRALRASARQLAGVAVFSGVINLLTLSGSLYMLQVYDRVIPSRNVATLARPFRIAGCLPAARAISTRCAAACWRASARCSTRDCRSPISSGARRSAVEGRPPVVAQQPLRDLDQVAHSCPGIGPTAFLDMPWMPLSCRSVSISPGDRTWATLGAAAIIAMTLLTESQSRSASKRATHSDRFADALRQNADISGTWHDGSPGRTVVARK